MVPPIQRSWGYQHSRTHPQHWGKNCSGKISRDRRCGCSSVLIHSYNLNYKSLTNFDFTTNKEILPLIWLPLSCWSSPVRGLIPLPGQRIILASVQGLGCHGMGAEELGIDWLACCHPESLVTCCVLSLTNPGLFFSHLCKCGRRRLLHFNEKPGRQVRSECMFAVCEGVFPPIFNCTNSSLGDIRSNKKLEQILAPRTHTEAKDQSFFPPTS